MTTYRYKLYLLKNGIKQHICENCKNTKWLETTIPLQLHHIDGNPKNNDIVNIQLLCPNCHSLTENYCGKNKKKKINTKKLNEDELTSALMDSYSIREALFKCQLNVNPFNYGKAKDIMEQKNIILKERIKKPRIYKPKLGKVKKEHKTKINWPEKDALEQLIINHSVSSIARQLGVSDNAIRKRAEKYDIDIKSLSVWSKRHGN